MMGYEQRYFSTFQDKMTGPLIVRTEMRIRDGPTARSCLDSLDDFHGSGMTVAGLPAVRPAMLKGRCRVVDV